MRALVLGSSGQIGSHLVKYLKNIGQVVIQFDIVNDDSQDLRNHCLDQLLFQRDYDFVFFLAFDVGGSVYLKNYQKKYQFIDNNIKIMDRTFQHLKTSGVPFIFRSSQMSNMLYSNYGILKAMGQRFTRSLGGLAVKFWNVYGLQKDPKKFHVVTDFILKAKRTGVIDMMTDGSQVRQFLHADDRSRRLYRLAKLYNRIPRNKQLHITSFDWISIMKVATTIAQNFQGTIIKPSPEVDCVQRDKQNQPDRYILQYWRPMVDIGSGIKMMIREIDDANL